MLVLVPPILVARLVAGDLLGVGTGLVTVLAFAGVASWFLPRRTMSGGRLLRAAQRRYPVSAGPEQGLDPGLAVALYGVEALLATLPQLARESGLLDGGRWSRFLGDSPLDSSSPPAGAATGHF